MRRIRPLGGKGIRERVQVSKIAVMKEITSIKKKGGHTQTTGKPKKVQLNTNGEGNPFIPWVGFGSDGGALPACKLFDLEGTYGGDGREAGPESLEKWGESPVKKPTNRRRR